MPPEDPEDHLHAATALIMNLILVRISLRARTTIELDLKELEKNSGRELPAVRAQLERLFELPSAPSFLPPLEPEAFQDAMADAPSKRRLGRPKKNRDVDAASETEIV